MSRRAVPLVTVLALVALAGAPPRAQAWGSAVHVYVADHCGRAFPLLDRHEMYGATLPDLFNYVFDPAVKPAADLTHYDVMQMWGAATCPVSKAVAFGYVSHNDGWAADFTAHHQNARPPGEGYVIEKAKLLAPALASQLTRLIPNAQQRAAVALGVSHILVEAGVDILLKRTDPVIGLRVSLAALLRGPQAPRLLVEAYADDLEPSMGPRPPRSSSRRWRASSGPRWSRTARP